MQGETGDSGRPSAAGAADLLICGLPRSGTSLTRGLVAAHPAYAVPRWEMTWWVHLYPRFRRRPGAWDEFLDALAGGEKMQRLALDPADLRARLATVPRGAHHAAFAAALALFAERRGRPRWGEKTLFAELYAEEALRALPNLKVVHLIRDPRDVYASYLHAPWRVQVPTRWGRAKVRVHGHLAWTIRNWRMSVRVARRLAAAWPDRYRAVRYEDLVGDPPGTLQALCAFAGVPYDARMLALDAFPDVVERKGNSSFGPLDGVSTQPVGRFRRVLPPRAIALCEALAGDELPAHGYVPAAPPLPAREAWRLRLVDRPVSRLIESIHAAALRLDGVPR